MQLLAAAKLINVAALQRETSLVEEGCTSENFVLFVFEA
jgi:hypothetical protein